MALHMDNNDLKWEETLMFHSKLCTLKYNQSRTIITWFTFNSTVLNTILNMTCLNKSIKDDRRLYNMMQ